MLEPKRNGTGGRARKRGPGVIVGSVYLGVYLPFPLTRTSRALS